MADRRPAAPQQHRRRGRRSVRAQATGSAVAVLAVVLVLGAALALLYTRASFPVRDVTAAAQQQADRLAEQLADGAEPDDLVRRFDDDDDVVQVVAPTGEVLAASEDLEDAAPITPESWPHTITLGDDDDEVFQAAAAWVPGTAAAHPGVQVVVGRSVEDATAPVHVVLVVFLVTIPAVLLVVGLLTWWLTGRAMRPVESMRREVEEITASSLGRRVPDPGGRDEVARLATTMNSMLERLDLAQAAQRRFVSDASHELRSPLASIRQNAEVAFAYPDAITQEDLAATTLAETLRMQHLVESLLVLTRSDENRLTVPRTPVDLDDLVTEEVHRLRGAGSITVDASGVSAARVDGDAQLLRQVLRNLVDNASRHAARTVALGLRQPASGHAVLTVDDDGHGIPEAERENVFGRFVRLDEARARDDGGSGLGLAIVREIVTAHGGTATMSTSPLGGARCTVVLPGSS